ncbi:MAG TPA: GrpB family protein [Clostridiaceae bacterium]|nr:GrpB family protein [Clostridiaceae bacterium]
MEINEKIHIEEYNPEWVKKYEYEKEQLCNALGDMVLGIEHVGSTSIPGIWAKPIVDIMIGVKSLPLEKSLIDKVVELGYECLGEAGVSGRIYFRKRFPKAYNVHITQFGNLIWKNNILLRDYLRCNKDEAMRYSELKKNIISEGVNDLLEYSERKADFINEILKKAKYKWSQA